MKALRFKRIEIRKPRYDPRSESSNTNNSVWRLGLFIIFEDYNGVEYDYMPKWSEVQELQRKKVEVEEANKELAKSKYYDLTGLGPKGGVL